MPRGIPVLALSSGALLLVSVAFLGLWLVSDNSQNHAYDPGATPPSTVALVAGKQYQLSTVDGPQGLTARHVNTVRDPCTWSVAGSAPQTLPVTPVAADSRSLHVVGTFVAPAGGEVRIECPVWGAVGVDDSEDSPVDLAGVFLLLGVITLTCGVIVGLTVLYRWSVRPAGWHARGDEVDRGESPVVPAS